jgi:hypothetical protein
MSAQPSARHGSLSRFLALSEAVKRHEAAAASGGASARPGDRDLYQHLRDLERSLPVGEASPLDIPGIGPRRSDPRNRFQRRGH